MFLSIFFNFAVQVNFCFTYYNFLIMSKVSYSKYQEGIFSFLIEGNGNAVVNAVAGAGKTFTITNALKLIPNNKSVLFLAFNKHIVDELKQRLQGIDNIDINTLHSYGNYVVKSNLKSYMVADKIKKYVDNNISYWGIDSELLDTGYANRIIKLIELSKLSLVDNIEGLTEIANKHGIGIYADEIERSLSVKNVTDKNNKQYDFADMLYFPLKFNLIGKQYDYVFVDECQDLSVCQQELMKRTLNKNGRFVAVGDPFQCIYGFAGSDTESFRKLVNLPNTTQLPLSITYRCSKAVTKLAKEIVPNIECLDNAPEGSVRYNGKLSEILPSDMVLCRTNKPLVSLCINFLKQGVKAYVKGKDIGLNLINMLKRTKRSDIEKALDILYTDRQKMIDKFVRKGNTHTEAENMPSVITYTDKLEAIEVLSEGCKSVSEVIFRIETIFAENNEGICLSTIHKAKGLEANRVFIVEPAILPAPWAKKEWEIEQENNITYVAYTRAKVDLVFIPENEFTTYKKR